MSRKRLISGFVCVCCAGQTLAEWFVDEYLFDPVTGAGNPSIGGFYFDDQVTYTLSYRSIRLSHLLKHFKLSLFFFL